MSGTGRRGASVATSVRVTRKKSAPRAVSLRETSIQNRLFGTTFLAGALAAAWIVGATRVQSIGEAGVEACWRSGIGF